MRTRSGKSSYPALHLPASDAEHLEHDRDKFGQRKWPTHDRQGRQEGEVRQGEDAHPHQEGQRHRRRPQPTRRHGRGRRGGAHPRPPPVAQTEPPAPPPATPQAQGAAFWANMGLLLDNKMAGMSSQFGEAMNSRENRLGTEITVERQERKQESKNNEECFKEVMARIEKLESGGGDRQGKPAENQTSEGQRARAWDPAHLILGFAPNTSCEDIVAQATKFIDGVKEHKKWCLAPYAPRRCGQIAEIRVQAGHLAAVTFAAKQRIEKDAAADGPRCASEERSPEQGSRKRAVQDAARRMAAAWPALGGTMWHAGRGLDSTEMCRSGASAAVAEARGGPRHQVERPLDEVHHGARRGHVTAACGDAATARGRA